MNKKKLIPVLVLLLLLSVSLILYTFLKDDKDNDEPQIDGLDIISKDGVTDSRKVGDLSISNVSYSIRDGITTFYAVVTNDSVETYNIKSLHVLFKYNDGSEEKILAIRDILLNSNDTTNISIDLESNNSDISSIDYLLG
ncbi:MAG: hypothetical protein IJO57_05135 [Bacilli bacterium]|nr:hypothetical protein [Bacilli bacterium]